MRIKNKQKNNGFIPPPSFKNKKNLVGGFTPIVDFDNAPTKVGARKNALPKFTTGFTLIELMVATSIFVVIMLASMGSLFTLLDASKNSRALRSAMDNVNFAMESMTRSIRMGTNYYCGTFSALDLTSFKDCITGGMLISFLPQGGESRIGYQVSNGVLKRYDANNTSGVAMVSPEVKIDTLKFFVKGSDPVDSTQASVYMIMKGTVKVKEEATSFSVQTMASQRNF